MFNIYTLNKLYTYESVNNILMCLITHFCSLFILFVIIFIVKIFIVKD